MSLQCYVWDESFFMLGLPGYFGSFALFPKYLYLYYIYQKVRFLVTVNRYDIIIPECSVENLWYIPYTMWTIRNNLGGNVNELLWIS